MSPRHAAPAAVALAVLLGAAGCAATEDPDQAMPAPAVDTTATITFCVHFPQRDAGQLFAVPDDPALAGDPAVIDQLLEIGASGVTESAPDTIRPAVETYVAALREYEPGDDPMADPAIGSAVEQIDAWLGANCPLPPGTAP